MLIDRTLEEINLNVSVFVFQQSAFPHSLQFTIPECSIMMVLRNQKVTHVIWIAFMLLWMLLKAESDSELELEGQLMFLIEDRSIMVYYDTNEKHIHAINMDKLKSLSKKEWNSQSSTIFITSNKEHFDVFNSNRELIQDFILESDDSPIDSNSHIINVVVKNKSDNKYLTVNLNTISDVYPQLQWTDNPSSWYFVQNERNPDTFSWVMFCIILAPKNTKAKITRVET